MITLAQDAAGASMFTNIFWLTIGFIFLTAIIGAVVARRQRDRCLKLIHDYHVTMQMTTGRTIWGDLHVRSQGLELVYDAPYQTAAGLIKSSYLLYDTEAASLHSIARYVGDLTEQEQRDREVQIRKRTNPTVMRRFGRWGMNWFNTIRDAFTQALSAFIGQIAKSGQSTVVSSQHGQVDTIGKTLLGATGNKYEPLLERHIGKPVVVELTDPTDASKATIELAGYLAEYSAQYIALFNVEHPHRESFELAVQGDEPHEGVELTDDGGGITIKNTDAIPLLINELHSDRGEVRDLGVVLTRGASAKLIKVPGRLTLQLARLPRLDLVAPRSQARVRHASLHELPGGDTTRHNLPPAHEDQNVAFP